MWQESDSEQRPVSGIMTDVVFRIDCEQLHVDHAVALSRAVCEKAPLLNDSPNSGIHTVHVAGSQNGWERPEDAESMLHLSKRTRLRIRVKKEQAQSLIETLEGSTLDVSGCSLRIISGQSRAIFPAPTLLSRYTFFEDIEHAEDEAVFVDRIIDQCQLNAFTPTKILCGRNHTINTDTGPRSTCSVLLADVPAVASTRLQDNGLGDGRTFGCGLLIPHKDTGAVHDSPNT